MHLFKNVELIPSTPAALLSFRQSTTSIIFRSATSTVLKVTALLPIDSLLAIGNLNRSSWVKTVAKYLFSILAIPRFSDTTCPWSSINGPSINGFVHHSDYTNKV